MPSPVPVPLSDSIACDEIPTTAVIDPAYDPVIPLSAPFTPTANLHL
jgi:hypothetical protein